MISRVLVYALSNAFLTSMKLMYSMEFHSTVCSIYSLGKGLFCCTPSFYKSSLFFLKCLFSSSAILLMIIFPRILDVVGVIVIPLQFPQQVRSPFFGNITIRPFFQSVGIVSSSCTIFLSVVCEIV